MTLESLGWDAGWETAFERYAKDGLQPARVVCELRRKFYAVLTPAGETLGQCTGKMFHTSTLSSEFPTVGDWVAIAPRPEGDRTTIHAVLPRRTAFSRRAAGDRAEEQVFASNIDRIFLVGGLDGNFNPARIQRFIVAARSSGAEPVILLNKADLSASANQAKLEIQEIAPKIRVLLTSAETGRGIKSLEKLLPPGKTVAFVGSSGVGKSSLVNLLVNDEVVPTGEVREKDGKGRHTTTRRELIIAESGALIIDTPGIRELKLWELDGGLAEAYQDITQLTRECRFSNCTHSSEPGCAIQAGLSSGTLALPRWKSFQKLRREHTAEVTRQERTVSHNGKRGWRQIQKERFAKQRIDPEK